MQRQIERQNELLLDSARGKSAQNSDESDCDRSRDQQQRTGRGRKNANSLAALSGEQQLGTQSQTESINALLMLQVTKMLKQ